jgi:hypothetical protein
MRKVALRLDEAFETGEVNRIDAGQLAQILLSIAEELDPPLPNRDRTTTTKEHYYAHRTDPLGDRFG